MTAKSDRARELLNDPMIQGSFESLREQYRGAMGDKSVSDDDVLELRRMLFLLDRLEKHLEQIVADGELEDLRAVEQERPSFLGELWQRKH